MTVLYRVAALPGVVEKQSLLLYKTPKGVKFLTATNTDPSSLLKLERTPKVNGPTELFQGETGNYQITDYSGEVGYVYGETRQGTLVATGTSFTFTVAENAVGSASFAINGRTFTVSVKPVIVAKPSVLVPQNGAVDVSIEGLTVTASAFALSRPGAVDTQISADWEIATDPNFTNIVKSSYDDAVNLTSFPAST